MLFFWKELPLRDPQDPRKKTAFRIPGREERLPRLAQDLGSEPLWQLCWARRAGSRRAGSLEPGGFSIRFFIKRQPAGARLFEYAECDLHPEEYPRDFGLCRLEGWGHWRHWEWLSPGFEFDDVYRATPGFSIWISWRRMSCATRHKKCYASWPRTNPVRDSPRRTGWGCWTNIIGSSFSQGNQISDWSKAITYLIVIYCYVPPLSQCFLNIPIQKTWHSH